MAGQLSTWLTFTIIAAALGSGFQHGYHTGVINVPEKVIKEWITATLGNRSNEAISDSTQTLLWSVTTSIMNIGGTIGGVLSGVITNKFGPRNAIIYNNSVLGTVACMLMLGCIWAESVEMLIIGRFLIGINAGLNAGICPMYLSEISPTNLRGAVGSVYQLVITISILIAQVVGLEIILGAANRWQWLFFIAIIPTVIQALILQFCPDSPKYLIGTKGNMEQAEKALARLRNKTDVSEELNEMKAEDAAIKAIPPVTLKEMVKSRYLKIPLIIAVVIMLAQQFSGINAVIFYSTSTFEKAGLEGDEPKYATIGIGVVNVVMTLVSLVLVEIAGRKTLLLVGFGGMAIDTLLLSLALHFADKHKAIPYICIILVFLYIILFAAGAGSIPWFLVSEIFNQAARPNAVSIAVPVNWIANFLVTLAFPSIESAIHSFVFLIFVVLDILFFIFIWKMVPETKNKTIDEITSQWK